MLKIFQICFRAGVLFTVVTFILGQLFDFMDFDSEIDLDGDFQGYAVSPLKPVVITAFVTVFGGVGEMALKGGMAQPIAFVLAIGVAFVVAALFFKFIIVPLNRAQNTSAKSQKELIGLRAKVDTRIEENGFGRINYTIGGNTYTAPAKSLHSNTILAGETVMISKIEDNVFYVEKTDF